MIVDTIIKIALFVILIFGLTMLLKDLSCLVHYIIEWDEKAIDRYSIFTAIWTAYVIWICTLQIQVNHKKK